MFELAASNSYCTSVHAPEQLIPSTETLRSLVCLWVTAIGLGMINSHGGIFVRICSFFGKVLRVTFGLGFRFLDSVRILEL